MRGYLSQVSQWGGFWNWAQAYQGYRAMSASDQATNRGVTAQWLHSCTNC